MYELSNTQLVTLIIAITGAVLGIINTWRSIIKDRIKIVVKPTSIFIFNNAAMGSGNTKKGVSIEIINLSAFAVTIAEIGFANFHLFRDKIKGKKLIPNTIENTQNKKLPVRLESRESTTFYILDATLKNIDNPTNIRYAYTRTACGSFIKGTSRLFLKALKDAKN